MATRTIHAFTAAHSGRRAPFGVRQAWTLVAAMFQARHTRRLLAEMDGRLLADIGASHSDAQMEAARPFWDVSPKRR